jgi:flagellar protein FlbD
MIKLTQINGDEITVNADLIETIEKAHDTIITLTTSRRIRVREDIEEIVKRVVDYKRRINSPGASSGSSETRGLPNQAHQKDE